MNGIFSISLDFELHWGGFEKWPLMAGSQQAEGMTYDRYFLNTREVIPDLLSMFREYETHVTWAAVGLLLHNSRQELLVNAPDIRPSYANPKLSAYHYIETIGIGIDEVSDPFHFAPTLVNKIIATPHQELGTHTFSHYYCNEDGQTLDQFREDLKAAQRVAKNYGCTLHSLVFPRNQFNDAYLKVCHELGITSVRSNPQDWFWKIGSTEAESFWKRLNRGADAYFPIGHKNSFRLDEIPVRDGFPICLPASRLLRPYNPKEYFLNELKLSRIKSEMTLANRNGEVYHLWWHPHNFGNFPEQSLAGLRAILNHFRALKMESRNMGELAILAAKPGS